MSKKKREPAKVDNPECLERQCGASAATAVTLDEVLRDPQAIAAAMEDTVEVVSEEVPAGGIDAQGIDRGPRDVAGKPSTIDLEDAMDQWGLVPADVIGWAGGPEEGLRVVTAGGQKLHWPQDMDRVLTDTEKGRTAPKATGEAGGLGRFARKQA